MVSHQPATFGDHMHCGSGDMILVSDCHNSTCHKKANGMKAHDMPYQ